MGDLSPCLIYFLLLLLFVSYYFLRTECICCGSISFWFKIFQTSLILIFLCLIFIAIFWDKEISLWLSERKKIMKEKKPNAITAVPDFFFFIIRVPDHQHCSSCVSSCRSFILPSCDVFLFRYSSVFLCTVYCWWVKQS